MATVPTDKDLTFMEFMQRFSTPASCFGLIQVYNSEKQNVNSHWYYITQGHARGYFPSTISTNSDKLLIS